MPSRRYQGTPAIAVAIALLPALLPSPLLRCRFCRRATPERREAIPTVFYLDWRLALASYSLPVAAVEIFLNNWMLLVSCWRPYCRIGEVGVSSRLVGGRDHSLACALELVSTLRLGGDTHLDLDGSVFVGMVYTTRWWR